MAQVDADARHDAVLQRILIDRRSAGAEMARRIDMRAAVVGHGEEHHAVAVHAAVLRLRLLVRLPDAVDDRWLARIARRAVIELAAQVDDLHVSPRRLEYGWRRPRGRVSHARHGNEPRRRAPAPR